MMTLIEAAQKHGVSRQGIYVAVKKKRLKAEMKSYRWMVNQADIDEYNRTKHKREFSLDNGKLLFDKKKGLYSVKEAAQYLGKTSQYLYAQLRHRKLFGSRRGFTWIIHIDEIERFKKTMRPKLPPRLPRTKTA